MVDTLRFSKRRPRSVRINMAIVYRGFADAPDLHSGLPDE